jgi:hypothetical protein
VSPDTGCALAAAIPPRARQKWELERVPAEAYACVEAWPNVWHTLPGVWRWLIVGFLIYGRVSLPIILCLSSVFTGTRRSYEQW